MIGEGPDESICSVTSLEGTSGRHFHPTGEESMCWPNPECTSSDNCPRFGAIHVSTPPCYTCHIPAIFSPTIRGGEQRTLLQSSSRTAASTGNLAVLRVSRDADLTGEMTFPFRHMPSLSSPSCTITLNECSCFGF